MTLAVAEALLAAGKSDLDVPIRDYMIREPVAMGRRDSRADDS